MNDLYTRMLTKEEVKQIDINELECHEYIEESIDLSENDFSVMYDDIMKNGMLEPIVLLDGKILDGRVRRAVVVSENINIEIPFAEYIGPKDKESVDEWLWKRNNARTHQTTTMKVVRAVNKWVPYYRELKKNKKKKGIPLLPSEEGEATKLAGNKVGIHKDTVQRGLKIKGKYPELYKYMEMGDLTLEEAYKVFQKCENWGLPWLEKVVRLMAYHDCELTRALKQAKQERLEEERIKYEEQKEKEVVKSFEIINSEYVDNSHGPSMIKATTGNKKISVSRKQENSMILTIDRWADESEAAFNKRVDIIMKGLNKLALVNGLTHVTLVSDENSKVLLNNALEQAEKVGGEIRAIEVEPAAVKEDGQDFKRIATNQPWSK